MIQSQQHADILASFAVTAVSQGVSPEQLTEVTGQPFLGLFGLSHTRADPITHRIISWLEQTHTDQPITLEFAKRVPLSILGPVVEAADYAHNVRELLDFCVSNPSAFSPGLRLELEVREEETALRMSHALDALGPNSAPEIAFGATARLLIEVHGIDDAIARVEFRHAQHGPRSAYVNFFRAPVVFEAEANRLVYRNAALTTPLPSPKPEQMQLLRRHLERIVCELEQREPRPLARVREAIARNAEHAEFGATAAAQAVGMSLRAMQRLARKHDTSVRELLEEARRVRAEQLLRDKSLSLTEVAERLDYSNEGAFRRAFKRWRGHSPAQHRRAL